MTGGKKPLLLFTDGSGWDIYGVYKIGNFFSLKKHAYELLFFYFCRE